MDEGFLNKYVVKKDSGGHGWQTYTLFASKEDLLALANNLKKQAEKPSINHDEYATICHGQNARVIISFQSASEDEIKAMHGPKRHTHEEVLAKGSCAFVFVVIIVFAAIGFFDVFG